MTTHRYHPDVARGDPEDAILWDDCARCDQQGHDPWMLDEDKTERMWGRMLHAEMGDGEYLTVNERRVGYQFYRMAVWVQRHMGIDPSDVLAQS